MRKETRDLIDKYKTEGKISKDYEFTTLSRNIFQAYGYVWGRQDSEERKDFDEQEEFIHYVVCRNLEYRSEESYVLPSLEDQWKKFQLHRAGKGNI